MKPTTIDQRLLREQIEAVDSTYIPIRNKVEHDTLQEILQECKIPNLIQWTVPYKETGRTVKRLRFLASIDEVCGAKNGFHPLVLHYIVGSSSVPKNDIDSSTAPQYRTAKWREMSVPDFLKVVSPRHAIKWQAVFGDGLTPPPTNSLTEVFRQLDALLCQ